MYDNSEVFMSLLSPFQKKRKGRGPNRNTDPESREKAKRARKMNEFFIDLATKNPAWKEKLIEKEFGISAPSSSTKSEADLKREELERSITDAALQAINSDPELKDELARQKAYEILGSRPQSKREDRNDMMVPYDDESSISKALREFREMKEFQEELGMGEKKSSFMDTFKDPEVMKTLLGFIANAVKPQGNSGYTSSQPQIITQPVKVYVVSVNGVDKELNETEYLQLKQSQQKSLEQPKTESPENQSDPIMAYLDFTPENFVKELNRTAQSNDPNKDQAIFLQNLLKDSDYDSICMLLTPYKDNPEYKLYVDKIVNRKKWVEAVIEEFKKPLKLDLPEL
jgi:hypothetical protein